MKLEIEVKRIRTSVTQGEAGVYVNGRMVVRFSDDIKIVKDGRPYYGDIIGGWASTKPDVYFISGLLWHPHDDYSDIIKAIMYADTVKENAKEERNAGDIEICTE